MRNVAPLNVLKRFSRKTHSATQTPSFCCCNPKCNVAEEKRFEDFDKFGATMQQEE